VSAEDGGKSVLRIGRIRLFAIKYAIAENLKYAMSPSKSSAIEPRFAFCPRLFLPACRHPSRFTRPICRSRTISAKLSAFRY